MSKANKQNNTGVHQEQVGFCSGLSCIHHINTLLVIVGHRADSSLSLHLLFVDFEKAFESVTRERIWNAIHRKRNDDVR